MYYVIYKVLFCLQISFVLKTWKYIINVLFFRKKHNFKNTTQKYITSSGEYSAVLHVTKKKMSFLVNKLCGGKCTRILKSYILAGRTTPAWNNIRHGNMYKRKYLLSISYVLSPRKCCCYFKFFKDRFFLFVTHLRRLNLISIVRDYRMYFCELGNTRCSQHYLNIKLFSQFVSHF